MTTNDKTLGQLLALGRNGCNKTLEEIQELSKIPMKYLLILEKDEYTSSDLQPFYIRSYITLLCNIYKIDSKPLLKIYANETGNATPIPIERKSKDKKGFSFFDYMLNFFVSGTTKTRKKRNNLGTIFLWIIGVVLAILITAFIGWGITYLTSIWNAEKKDPPPVQKTISPTKKFITPPAIRQQVIPDDND